MLALARYRCQLEALVGALLGGSRYHCAFARGVQALLQEFYDRVSDVEAEVLDDGSLTPVHVQRRVRRFSAALPPVARVARACCGARGLRGGALLQRLYEGSQDGDPLLAETFRALLWHAQQPFFSHLVAWMAYAELEEGEEEEEGEKEEEEEGDDEVVERSVEEGGAGVGRADEWGFGVGGAAPRCVARGAEFFVRRAAPAAGAAPPSVVCSYVLEGAAVRGDGAGEGGGSDGAPVAPGCRLRVLAGGAPRAEGGAPPPPGAHALRVGLARARAEYQWLRGFVVDDAAVPAFFPQHLATAALDVGRTLRLLVDDEAEGGGAAAPGALAQSPRAPQARSPASLAGGAAAVTAHAPPAPAGAGPLQWPPSQHAAGLRREDSLAIAQVLLTLRSAPFFSLLAAECVINRVRDAALARLWLRLGRGAAVERQCAALRSFLLLGRGDLFQAFLRGARGLLASPRAEAPGALRLLVEGPWRAAAAAVGLLGHGAGAGAGGGAGAGAGGGAGASGGGGGRGEEAPRDAVDEEWDAECFPRVTLSLCHRALRFEAPLLVGAGSGGGSSSSSSSSSSARAPGALAVGGVLRSWQPSTSLFPPPEALAATPRALATLTLTGSAAPLRVQLLAPPPVLLAGSVGGDGGVNATAASNATSQSFFSALSDGGGSSGGGGGGGGGGARDAPPPATAEKLFLAGGGGAGAVWLTAPVSVSRGFFLRACLSVSVPAVGCGEGAAPPPTASFALVIHRDHALSVGRGLGGGGSWGAGAPPGRAGGFEGVRNSLAVHFLLKRLPAEGEGGGSGGRGGAAAAPWRLVAAVYGAPRLGGGEESRPLLGSAAVKTIFLPREGAWAGGGGEALAVYPLAVALEYVPADVVGGSPPAPRAAPPAPAPPPGDSFSGAEEALHVWPGPPAAPAGAAVPARGRLRVAVLEADAVRSALNSAAAWSRGGGGISGGAHAASTNSGAPAPPPAATRAVYASATRALLEVPLCVEEALNFSGVGAPGRGRAWLGVAAGGGGGGGAQPSGARGARVALEALDGVSFSDADEGVGGCVVGYALPPLMHTLFSSGALAAYEDVFRFGLRAKGAALGLLEAWRHLRGGRAGGGAGGGASSGGARAAAARSLSLQALLLPVHHLRARLQLVVDALLFHLHVDCVAGAGGALSAALCAAGDFSALQRAVGAHAKRLLADSLLQQPSVHATLHRILSHAEGFASLVCAHAGDALPGLLHPEKGRPALARFSDALRADVRFLATLGGQASLAGLLSRMDADFFASTA